MINVPWKFDQISAGQLSADSSSTETLFFTLREPNIYKPHGFFLASSSLLFAFVLLFCFISLFVFCIPSSPLNLGFLLG